MTVWLRDEIFVLKLRLQDVHLTTCTNNAVKPAHKTFNIFTVKSKVIKIHLQIIMVFYLGITTYLK